MLGITIAIGFLMVPFPSIYSKTGNLLNSTVYADSNEQSETQDPHSNNSVTNPINWDNWQKNPIIYLNTDIEADDVTAYYHTNRTDEVKVNASWESAGDTMAVAKLSNSLTYNYELDGEDGEKIPGQTPGILNGINVNGNNVPNDQTKTTSYNSFNGNIGTSFTFPITNYLKSNSMSSGDSTSQLQADIQIHFTDPCFSYPSVGGYTSDLSNGYFEVYNPQIIRVFYKDSKTGKDIQKPIVLGENGHMGQPEETIAPKIKGYSLRPHDALQYQTANSSKAEFINAVRKSLEQAKLPQPDVKELSKEYDGFYGSDATISPLNYMSTNSEGISLANAPELLLGEVNMMLNNKSIKAFDYFKTDSVKYSDNSVIQDLKLSDKPQAIIFWYNPDSSPVTPSTPTTPTTPTTPVTPSTPTTSSSSSSSSSTSSTSSSTPTSSSSSSSSTSLPNYAAAKGTVVYSINKIGLYKSTKFSATNRSAWYTKKPRVYRPMFVVTGYKRAANGALRYRVRDVNHTSKTNGKTGYITASQKYVRPVYYATKHSTISVINPRGVNAYRKANLTKKARSYRQGTVLHVRRIVTHNLTTRYVLTNGDYITANRKLVNMGRHQQAKSVKTKRAVNRYSNANFTKRNRTIAKNRTLKVYGYDYSQKNSATKHGALRYRVAGGYITANTKYVRAYK